MARALLESVYAAAIERVAPGPRVRDALVAEPLPGPLRLLALGKAALPMARAACAVLAEQGCEPIEALAVAPATSVAADAEPACLRVRVGAHPVPDARSEAAGLAALAVASRCRGDERLLVLLSGGASSLLSAPADGLSLEDLAAATGLLLRAGAPIELLNGFRRHATRVSGGRLAQAAGAAAIRVLAVSDVAGDDPSVLASGPCSGDSATFADALAGIDALGVRDALPIAVRRHLEAGVRGDLAESLAPGDPALSRVAFQVVASLADALDGAADSARACGLRVLRHAEELAGEAREAGSSLAREARGTDRSVPTLLLAGGETIVTVVGDGRGGRSQELALAAALELEDGQGITLLAAGTDGIDGPTDAAGGFADGGTVARGREHGRSAEADLARNDAYGFFAAEGGSFQPGATGTNVRDLVMVHITPDAAPPRGAAPNGAPSREA